MKALTFLEYYKIAQIDYSNNIELLDKLDAYFNFVSQLFKPEMIVEYFEVAQKDNDYNNSKSWIRDVFIYPELDKVYNWRVNLVALQNPINSIYVCAYDSYWYFGIDGNLSGFDRFKRHKFMKPKTVNDFISDCGRASIELTFKQTVIL